jgi:hypothetical protein
MSLTKAKVLSGPFTITGKTGGSTSFTYAGLKNDALVINTEDVTKELEDYTTDLEGRHLTAEITLSELDTTDLAKIKDTVDTIEILFTNKSKTFTIAAPDEVRAKVDNGKTKITIKKFVAGSAWPFTIV